MEYALPGSLLADASALRGKAEIPTLESRVPTGRDQAPGLEVPRHALDGIVVRAHRSPRRRW